MKGERFYVVSDDGRNWQVVGWNLDHEPTPDNECGYATIDGPYATKEEAEANCPESGYL